jgi:hypothetical protein
MLHHKFLCRSCVENEVRQVNKTQRTADIDGWSRPLGERPTLVERVVGSVIVAVGVDRGVFLDPVYLVLVTLWSPDLSTREHRDKEVTT